MGSLHGPTAIELRNHKSCLPLLGTSSFVRQIRPLSTIGQESLHEELHHLDDNLEQILDEDPSHSAMIELSLARSLMAVLASLTKSKAE